MCRDKDHAGNRNNVRCDCDTSEARQARRERARLRAQFGAVGEGPAAIDFTTNANAPAQGQAEAPAAEAIVEPLTRGQALAAAQGALSAYQQVAADLIIRETPPRHDVPLRDTQVEAEARIVELGKAVEALAVFHGAPSEQEWEMAQAKWEAAHEVRVAERDAVRAEFARIDRAYKVAPLRPTNESFASKAEAREARNAYVTVHNAAMRKFDREDVPHEDPALAKLIARRADAFKGALSELGVEFASGKNLTYRIDKPRPKAEKNLRKAIEYYPDAWVTKAQLRDAVENRTLRAFQQGSRAHYEPSTNRIRLSTAAERDLAHELGHYLEGANRELGEAERAFIHRRSGLLAHHQNPAEAKKPIQRAISRGERGYQGGFAHNYVGRIYPYDLDDPRENGHYEVLTTGMEVAFFGRLGAGVGAGRFPKDAEHLSFTLGLLASSIKQERA
jgi:hypothetical protein